MNALTLSYKANIVRFARENAIYCVGVMEAIIFYFLKKASRTNKNSVKEFSSTNITDII